MLSVILDNSEFEFCAFGFFTGSRALFMKSTNMEKRKSNFKTGFYSTIYIFKNYFTKMLSIFSFQQ